MNKNSNINSYNAFKVINPKEGKDLKDKISLFKNRDRYYKNINLTKVVLSTLLSDYVNNHRNVGIFSTDFKLFFIELKQLIKSIIFYETKINIVKKGKIDFWFVSNMMEKLRPSYQEEVKKYFSYKESPYFVSWKTEKSRFKVTKIINKIFKAIKILRMFQNSSLSLLQIIKFTRVSLDVMDFVESFKCYNDKPEIIFSLKDFQHFENGIIQYARNNGIKTFTSQHCVFPDFKGENYRFGLAYENCASEYLMSWGEFNENLFKKFSPDLKIIRSKSILIPNTNLIDDSSNNFGGKINLLIASSGRRHEIEFLSLIKIIDKIDDNFRFNRIIFRLHPTLNKSKYKLLFDNIFFQNNVIIDEGNSFNFNYPINNTIAITALSGIYYDLLYFGYKTIFYNFGFELNNVLPRVITLKENTEDIIDQISFLHKMTTNEWELKANKILKKTLNLTIREKRGSNIIQEIWNLKLSNNH